MKSLIPKLKIGDLVDARVVELVHPEGLIVSLAGDLIRVQNRSRSQFRQGQTVQLKVVQIKPLQFQLFGQRRGFERRI